MSPALRLLPALLAVGSILACGFGGGGAAPCATSTHCVNDSDCASGSRCNSALSPPACQPLYCGGSGSACSDGYFCESLLCSKKACLATSAPNSALGGVVPTVVRYFNQPDGGFGGSVYFSDDARNDCATMTARMEYGSSATLKFSRAIAEVGANATVTLITDDLARQGKGPTPSAYFVNDSLSGVDLKRREGTVTLLRLPTPTTQELVLSLQVADGGVDGTFTARPFCP